jgi:hypothetical protein
MCRITNKIRVFRASRRDRRKKVVDTQTPLRLIFGHGQDTQMPHLPKAGDRGTLRVRVRRGWRSQGRESERPGETARGQRALPGDGCPEEGPDEMTNHFAETKYGFEWGAASVTRCFSDDRKGWVTLLLKTPKTELQIYVTKTGKVRVHDRHGEWLPKGTK